MITFKLYEVLMGVIKSERELAISKQRVQELSVVKGSGFLDRQAELGIKSFRMQIEDEIKEYENLKKGKIPAYLLRIENLGLLLIALRIKHGLTQAELARQLGVAASQVSRDENNEYHGVSLTTVKKILAVLGENLKIKL